MSLPPFPLWLLGLLFVLLARGRKVLSMGTPPETPERRREFFLVMGRAIQQARPDLSTQTKLLLVAQAALESAWGGSRSFRRDQNPFRIKSVEYDTLEEAVEQYLEVLERYGHAKELLLAGDVRYVVELGGHEGLLPTMQDVLRDVTETAQQLAHEVKALR